MTKVKVKCTGNNNNWGGENYITVGKVYEGDYDGRGIGLTDDDGSCIYALLTGSAHGFEFEVVEETQEESMKTKFKVGDKVKVLTQLYSWLFPVGTVGRVESYDDDGDVIVSVENDYWYYKEESLELVEQEETQEMEETTTKNFIKAGETYKSKEGRDWTCIHTEGDLAWCKSGEDHAAYVFKTDGTPVSLGSYSHKSTLLPNREVVELFGGWPDIFIGWNEAPMGSDTHKITFELDFSGQPVLDSIKMERLEKE